MKTIQTPQHSIKRHLSRGTLLMTPVIWAIIVTGVLMAPPLAAQMIVQLPGDNSAVRSNDSLIGTGAQPLLQPSLASVQFSVDTMTVGPTDPFDLAVRCGVDFNNVTSFQFSLSWDPTVFQFNSVGSFGIGTVSGMFNILPATTSQGRLSLVWEPASAGPESYPSGTTIFKLNLTPLGGAGTGSSFQFGDVPTLREVTVNFSVVPFDGQMGQVSVVPEPTKAALVFGSLITAWGLLRSLTRRVGRKD
jgi:hypothetical protein